MNLKHIDAYVPEGAVVHTQWHVQSKDFDAIMHALKLDTGTVKRIRTGLELNKVWFRTVRFSHEGMLVTMFDRADEGSSAVVVAIA